MYKDKPDLGVGWVVIFTFLALVLAILDWFYDAGKRAVGLSKDFLRAFRDL